MCVKKDKNCARKRKPDGECAQVIAFVLGRFMHELELWSHWEKWIELRVGSLSGFGLLNVQKPILARNESPRETAFGGKRICNRRVVVIVQWNPPFDSVHTSRDCSVEMAVTPVTNAAFASQWDCMRLMRTSYHQSDWLQFSLSLNQLFGR
jgi:hypothetical protein